MTRAPDTIEAQLVIQPWQQRDSESPDRNSRLAKLPEQIVEEPVHSLNLAAYLNDVGLRFT